MAPPKTILFRALMAISLATTCFTAATGSSSKVKRELSADEMILFNNEGQTEVVSRSKYLDYTNSIAIATPEQHYGNLSLIKEKEPTDQKLVKRCEEQNVFTTLPVEKYINWDVPMSAVVRAPSHSIASISVSGGYWIGNSLRVSAAKNIAEVQAFLFKTLGIAYDKSWTTTYSSGYSYSIPAGKYGAIVSNPLATRHSGYMDSGCIGSTKRTEYSLESYQSKSFSQMTWVDGIISLCVGDSYPLKRCIGDGTL